MNTTYKEREEALFERWLQACIQYDGITPSDFAWDGLLFRGECKNINGCWEMQPGNETQLWDNAPCRLLILTKDTTLNGGMDDMRIESARKNHTFDFVVTTSATFYRNLSLWSYALINAVQGGTILPYDDTPDWDKLRELYTTLPIARVNCKKQIGESSISNAKLKEHISRYAEFLTEQVSMYDADIILCCGGGGVIKDFVKVHYLPDLLQFSHDAWVHHSPSTLKIVIDSFHPSVAKRPEEMYENMMADLKGFLTHHPEYLKLNR